MSGSSTSTSGSTTVSTLWAHLLNKDATASGSGSKSGLTSLGLTVSAPVDKTGTSVRILLHDTQATIEKFAERVDRLLSEAEDSRQKLLARNEEVNDDVERLFRRVIQEQVGRTETTLRSCIGEPAQVSALTELQLSISSSLDALNQKVEAVQNLAHINTQALQTIKDQQLQILTAIIPLLPSLQKVPLHIASTEANLKEAIRKSAAAAAPITGTQFTNIGSISGSRKRRSPKNPYHCTPSPSVTKRKRIRVDTSCTTQQQLPSPKSSRDSLLIQGGLPTTNHHRSIGDALRSSSRPPSGSIDTAQTPNPGRLSMQPPTPMILSTTPSRRQSIFLPEMPVQPTSSLSHKRESTSGVSVTPVFARPAPGTKSDTPVPFHHLNHSRDAFKVSTRLHTPLHSDSKRLNDQQTRPSAQPPSSVGFSARRGKRFIPITDDDEDDEIFDD